MAETFVRFPELIYNEDFERLQNRRKFLKPMEGFDALLETARTRQTTLESMLSAPLLTKDQEQYLFRQYNCLKHEANLVREKENRRDREKLARLYGRVKEVQDVLCMCNMRLGVAQLKKRVLTPDQFDIQLSFVEESLLRAIRRFNYALGWRFSTYGTWAIIKNLRHSISEMMNGRVHYYDELPLDPSYEPDYDQGIVASESVDLMDDLLNCLTPREQVIIRLHKLNNQPKTLAEIGFRLKITRERVRQIEIRALRILKEVAHERYPNLVGAI